MIAIAVVALFSLPIIALSAYLYSLRRDKKIRLAKEAILKERLALFESTSKKISSIRDKSLEEAIEEYANLIKKLKEEIKNDENILNNSSKGNKRKSKK